LADILFCRCPPVENDGAVEVIKIEDDDISPSEVGDALLSEDSDVFSRVSMSSTNFTDEPWYIMDEVTKTVVDEMINTGWELGSRCKIVKSMETGLNEALTVDEETISEYDIERELLRPLAKTTNVRRYLIRDTKKYVLWTEVDEIDDYPNTKSYLRQYKSKLLERYDIEQRGADWWRISNPRNEELFDDETKRILTPFMSTSNKFAIDTEKHFNDGGDLRAIFPTEQESISIPYVAGVLNSTAGELYHKNTAKLKRDGYYEYYSNTLDDFPIPCRSELTSDEIIRYIDDSEEKLRDIDASSATNTEDDSGTKKGIDIFVDLVNRIQQLKQDYHSLNLSLQDYLGTYSGGSSLADLYQPPVGIADSILTDTTKKRSNLRLGTVTVADEDSKLVVWATARYKPENQDGYETDRWGYTETDSEAAMEFVGLTEQERTLIRAFVPYAVSEAGGFADFRETATKTNSVVDRLEALTLPALADIEDGLERYRETKESADELEEMIEKTDELIDQIVYRLYGLTDEEIEVVEEAVGDD